MSIINYTVSRTLALQHFKWIYRPFETHLTTSHRTVIILRFAPIMCKIYAYTRSVRKVSSHFEYLENRLRGLDVTWQPVREDLTVHL